MRQLDPINKGHFLTEYTAHLILPHSHHSIVRLWDSLVSFLLCGASTATEESLSRE